MPTASYPAYTLLHPISSFGRSLTGSKMYLAMTDISATIDDLAIVKLFRCMSGSFASFVPVSCQIDPRAAMTPNGADKSRQKSMIFKPRSSIKIIPDYRSENS